MKIWLPIWAAVAASVGLPIVPEVGAAPESITLPPETAKLKTSTLAGYQIAAQKCSICHSADYINYQPPGMTLTQWKAEVVKMQHVYGAPVDELDVEPLALYLTATYGDAASISPVRN